MEEFNESFCAYWFFVFFIVRAGHSRLRETYESTGQLGCRIILFGRIVTFGGIILFFAVAR